MGVDAFLELKQGGKNVCLGETLDAKFSAKGAMQLISFQLQSKVDLADESASEPSGDDSLFTLNVKKAVDNASPDLFRAYCMHSIKKEPFQTAILTIRKAAGPAQLEFMIIELTNVTLQTYKIEDSGSDGQPEETMDLVFRELMIKYFPQKGSGVAGSMKSGGWDFDLQRPI